MQSFAAIAQHYAIDQASPISKWHLVPLSGGMLAVFIRARRVPIVLIQDRFYASAL